MEITLNSADEHAPETLAQSLVIGRTVTIRLAYLNSETASAINALSAVHIRF